MGLETNAHGTYIYINKDGKFTQKVKEGTIGAIPRNNKVGTLVHELFHDAFQGMLVNIRVTESEKYGKSWIFDFSDGDAMYHLQLSYSNSFATAFLKMLPNIDVTKRMKLTPSVKVVEGKNKSTLFVNQNDQAIKHAYTMDNPNGLPDMEKIKVKGQDTWDDTKRLEFLRTMVETHVLPKLNQKAHVPTGGTVEPTFETFGEDSGEQIPF